MEWIAIYESGAVERCEADDLDEAIDILARADDPLAYSPTPVDSEIGAWIATQAD